MAKKKIKEEDLLEMIRKSQELKTMGDEDKLQKIEDFAMEFSDVDIGDFINELGKIAGDSGDEKQDKT